MKNLRITHRLLVGCAFCAIVFLFFHQARLALRPVPIALDRVPIAFGYSVDTFTGTVYHDEGTTAIGAGTGVALHVNGTSIGTDNTDANGLYSFADVDLENGDIITVFVNNGIIDGALIAKLDTELIETDAISGMDIYKDRLILRSDNSDLNITTVNLKVADNVGDSDVTEMYTIVGDDLLLGNSKELYIWPDTTHTTSGSIFTHDLDIRGELSMGTSEDITASGSIQIGPAGITTTGDIIMNNVGSGEFLISNDTVNNLYFDTGLHAYFRFDEGTGSNSSGSSLNTQTGGSLSGDTTFTTANTGTTLFYNSHAVEFDGTDDWIDYGDAYDLSQTGKRTFATWFRRKSATTEDVIFSKKLSTGASLAGYILYIDDESDKLLFEVADGSNRYVVTSNSTITDQNWHHVAVSYDGLNTQAINIFLDGAIDVSLKDGNLESSGAINGDPSNAFSFLVGDDSNSSGSLIGSVDDLRMYNRAMSGDELSVLGTGAKETGSGTIYLKKNIDINGNFGVYGATLNIGTGYSLNIAGDLTAYGDFQTNSGTVTLDGTSQTIRGSTAFKELSKSTTVADTLTFESNTEQTVSGALTLKGASNQRLSLRASVTAVENYLIAEYSGATLLEHLDVKDDNAFSGALLSCTSGCVDSGNNTNWEFLGECQDGIVNTGEECDDGNANNDDSCPNDCKNAVCGDGVKEGREQCEPPNAGNCQSNCLLRGVGGGGGARISSAGGNASYFNRPDPPEGCGNGILDTNKNEECDAGERFNGLGTCSFDCKLLRCGDGVISPQIGEDCEPKSLGKKNGVETFEVATCGETCTAPEVTITGTVFGGCRKQFLMPCGSGNASSAPAASGPSVCGNGTVESGEECDFGGVCEGGSFNGSFWTDKNSADTCASGGGTPKPASGDGCSDKCKTEFCGDGVIQERGADNQPNTSDDEDCDNGSVCSNDSSKSCRLDANCGVGNTCEYHGAKDNLCSSSCKRTGTPAKKKPAASKPSAPKGPTCGNGKTETGEECDNGARNGTDGSDCSTSCRSVELPKPAASEEGPSCGNGRIDDQEECDSGSANSDVDPNACRTHCVQARCGDFVVDANEQCDNGDGNSSLYADTCRDNCRLPYCGDGILDSNEECDGSLSCLSNCRLAMKSGTCGNGVKESGEQCDDGNRTPGDGCSTLCQKEPEPKKEEPVCGNGKVEEGEQCDDGNTEEDDGCSAECRIVEMEIRAVAQEKLQLDADVIIVNPTEIATALKFIGSKDPCCEVVAKGEGQMATLIRAAALDQKIPIIRNIPLARTLFSDIDEGQEVFGELCEDINEIKKDQRKVKSAAPQKIDIPEIHMPKAASPPVPQQPLPQAPTMYAQGYYPYAQFAPVIQNTAPVGDTGPAAVAVAIGGASGALTWLRRKKKS